MTKIAITGAAGLVGSGLRRQWAHAGYHLVLIDRSPITDAQGHETAVLLDINNQPGMTAALAGCDAVVHLAGCTTDADWPEQVRLSVEGSISVFEAARLAGVPRVIYASSNHVVGMYPRSTCLTDAVTLRPDSRYGVGKAFGESLAAMYALKYGLQVLVIRIGNTNDRPVDRRRLAIWISWRDFAQLVAIGVTHANLTFSTVYGVSDRSGRFYDNSAAYALGYAPQDNPDDHVAEVLRQDPEPQPGSEAAHGAAEIAQGGSFSASEFVGSPERLGL